MGDVEKIKKISRIASTWWSDVIENAKMDNGDTTDSGAMTMLLLKLRTPKVTPEQQKQFKLQTITQVHVIFRGISNWDTSKAIAE